MKDQSEHPRLRMSGINKAFSGVRVLKDVDFVIAPGEVVAILGSNGAGKSTLVKILTGVYTRDSGQIEINGETVEMATSREAAKLGISFLPQEISVIVDMTVAENICMASLGSGNFVNYRMMRKRSKEILEELGFGHISVNSIVGSLSVAEQRIVEIARALSEDASILVMDEPTASLSEQESVLIFEIINRLKANKTSIVYISHYLKEVFEIADRIEILRDGENEGSFRPEETDVNTVVNAMLGRVAGQLFDKRDPLDASVATLFKVDDLQWKNRINGISLDIKKGEIVGVFGMVGSGVEVLGRVLFGAEGGGYSGEMTLADAPYKPNSPRVAKAAGMGFVTAERKKDGILSELSVRENIAAAFQTTYGYGPFTSPKRELILANSWIEKLGIKTSGSEQALRLLSGGNQQKVCVARWLHPSVKMLILEEPTRGVDVGARKDLYTHLVHYAREGLAILVLSSDVEEVAGLCDRSLVIDRGQIVAEYPAGTDASVLMAATAGTYKDVNEGIN